MLKNDNSKIAIIFDSNIFMSTKDIVNLKLFTDMADYIAINYLDDIIGLFIPEICYLELRKHKRQELVSNVNKLKELNKQLKIIPQVQIIIGELDFEKSVDDYFQNNVLKSNILNIPSNRSQLFEKVLNKGVYKMPPFIEGDSDKGFKDAILFESIIDFAIATDYVEFYLFTADNGFVKNIDALQDEFFKLTEKKLYINYKKDVLSWFMDKFKIDIDLRNFINKEFVYILNQDLDIIKYIHTPEGLFPISDIIKDDNKTYLEKIEDKKFKLTIFGNVIYFNYELQKEQDMILGVYYLYKENDIWKVNVKSNDQLIKVI